METAILRDRLHKFIDRLGNAQVRNVYLLLSHMFSFAE